MTFSNRVRQRQPFQQMPRKDIYSEVPSTGRNNYDGSKWGSQVILLKSHKDHWGKEVQVDGCFNKTMDLAVRFLFQTLSQRYLFNHNRSPTSTSCLLVYLWHIFPKRNFKDISAYTVLLPSFSVFYISVFWLTKLYCWKTVVVSDLVPELILRTGSSIIWH